MKTLVLGAGALGSLIGGRLAAKGLKVCLLSDNVEHVQAINKNGLIIQELDESKTKIQAQACAFVQDVPFSPELVLVLVKSYSTKEAVASILDLIGKDTVFLTLQNGLGNPEEISSLVGNRPVLAGVTAQGATYLGPGNIMHGGNGPTQMGSAQGKMSALVEKVVGVFNFAGLSAQPAQDIEVQIWNKLMINIGINAMTALAGVPNGWISSCAPAKEVALEAVNEALNVAQAKGIELSENIQDKVLEVARSTARNTSSMLQDLSSGNRTEIMSINGAIVSLGEEMQISVPVNRTLVNLVKTIEIKNRSV